MVRRLFPPLLALLAPLSHAAPSAPRVLPPSSSLLAARVRLDVTASYRLWANPAALPASVAAPAPAASALAAAARLRELVAEGPESKAELEASARALDQLRAAADAAKELPDVWVRERSLDAVPVAVPWPQYRAMLLRRGAESVLRLAPQRREWPWRFVDKALGRAKLATKLERAAGAAYEAASLEPAERAAISPEDAQVIGELSGAVKSARAVFDSLPFASHDAAKRGMRSLAFALTQVVHRGEAALALKGTEAPLLAREALMLVESAYLRRGEGSGAGALARYTEKQLLAEEFWKRVGYSYWVPEEPSRRETWLRSLRERLAP